MGRKKKKNKHANEEAIRLEISQKTQALEEVQAELRNFKSMWTSNSCDEYEELDSKSETLPLKTYKKSQQKVNPRDGPKALHTIEALESKCALIKSSFDSCLSALNDLEQYTRRQNLLFSDLDVDLDLYDYDFVVHIVKKLNEILPKMKFGEITNDDINDAHPLYTKEGSKPLVIVQFNKRWIRNEVLKVKKSLKSNWGVRVMEHLTKHNRDMLNKARDIVGGYYAWSQKGVVYASLEDGTKMAIKNEEDLNHLQSLGCTPRVPPQKKYVKKTTHRTVNSSSHSHPPQQLSNANGTASHSQQYHTHDDNGNFAQNSGNGNPSNFYYNNDYNNGGSYFPRGRGRGRGYFRRGHRGRGV